MTMQQKQNLAVVLSLALVAATALFFSKPALSDADVPEVKEQVVDESGTKWYNPASWPAYQAVKEKLNEEQQLRDRIADLEVQNDQYRRQILGSDELLEAAKEQNDKTIAHFEGLLAERDRQVKTLREQKAALDAAIQALEDKDNSMMYVEGCWVPINTGHIPVEE